MRGILRPVIKPRHRDDGPILKGALKAARRPYATAAGATALALGAKVLLKKDLDGHDGFGVA